MNFLNQSKPGRKRHDRTQSSAMLAEAELWAAACERAKREKRDVEFNVPATPGHGARTLLALPNGTVTSPYPVKGGLL